MSRRITGTLTGATGDALGGLTIRLTAVLNTPDSIPAGHVVEIVTTAAGDYDVTLSDGRYRVEALYTHATTTLGHIDVSDGADTDLITLLGAEGVSPTLAQQLLDQLAELDDRFPAIDEHDAGNSGAAKTIPFDDYASVLLTLTDNCTLTLATPPNSVTRMLRLVQDASGGHSVTWPTVLWGDGEAPTLASAAGAETIVLLKRIGGNWRGEWRTYS